MKDLKSCNISIEIGKNDFTTIHPCPKRFQTLNPVSYGQASENSNPTYTLRRLP
ncbi:hypothetical protein [Rubritalea tangerina]|uniref:hypothetical protein n=1 Tax=Rubritalea tangerina TaxID=430798 RepID=UPI00361B4D05